MTTEAIHIKEEASFPTMSLEAMMLSFIIEAKENRYAIVADITGAFYTQISKEQCTLY